MPQAQLFFGNDQRSGDQQIAGASPQAYNVLIDGAGAVRRRPGIVLWPDITSGFGQTSPLSLAGAAYGVPDVNGITSFQGTVHYTTAPKAPFLTSSQQHLQVSQTTGEVTGHFSGGVSGVQRPTFALTQFRLVCASGGVINVFDPPGGSLTGPTSATEVVALASRLMCNDTTSTTTNGRVLYSGTGSTGNLTFGALSFVPTEAKPDAIQALRENSNELFAFGERSLQILAPDGQVVLAPQRTVNRGCSAPHSIVALDESFAWLDDRQQFVLSDGRTMEVISEPIDETLDSVETVSDCWGFRCNLGQFDALVWIFPTDGRGFSYQRGGAWSQWSTWDGNGHGRFAGTAHYYYPEQGRHLVGLPMETLGYLSLSAQTDYVPDQYGSTNRLIKADVTTGFVNHGTDTIKFTDELRLTFKRGQASTAPHVKLSWRNDLGDFGEPRRIDLGSTGDYLFTVRLQTLGGYRARQWKLEMDAAEEMVLARVEESFSLGEGN